MIFRPHHARVTGAACVRLLLSVAALLVASWPATPQPTSVAGAPSLPVDPAAAQATATPPATPTQVLARFEPPPRAMLTVGGETQEAGVGSYCWDGVCRGHWDGWITPVEPLRVRSPMVGRLSIEVDPVPTDLYLSMHRFESHIGFPFGDGRFAVWPPEDSLQIGPRYLLPLARAQDLQLVRDPGLYVIWLSAFWKDIGDVSYGFLVEVER